MPANHPKLNAGDRPDASVLSLCLQLFGKPGEALSDVEVRAAARELGVDLPPSYRTFLRFYGSDLPASVGLFGLPRGRLWRDLVLVNEADTWRCSPHFVKIGQDHSGRAFFLDTARPDGAGECPVLIQAPELGAGMVVVANNFVGFLELAAAGLLSEHLAVTDHGT